MCFYFVYENYLILYFYNENKIVLININQEKKHSTSSEQVEVLRIPAELRHVFAARAFWSESSRSL